MPLDLKQLPLDRIRALCERHHVRRLAIFGSALRDDFTDESDIDVLVEFFPGKTPGFGFFAMQDELTEMLGRKVDLQTPGFLSRYFRDDVMRSAEDLYVAA